MNTKITPSIIQIEKESLKQLTKEVKETIANHINMPSKGITENSFGIVDMWNSQRNVRTAISRRRYHPKSF